MTIQTIDNRAPAITEWAIDPAHSTVEFAVKHMMVSTVKGRFGGVQGIVRFDEAGERATFVEASVDVASVDTGQPERDAHLRSDDFFNAERYPRLTFQSTSIEAVGDGRYALTGDLTIRDVTRPVTFDVEFAGRGPDAYGGERAGFSASARINRRDFGVSWNGLIEAGGVVVSDTVRIQLHIQLVRAG